jgi:hypothetical protein
MAALTTSSEIAAVHDSLQEYPETLCPERGCHQPPLNFPRRPCQLRH